MRKMTVALGAAATIVLAGSLIGRAEAIGPVAIHAGTQHSTLIEKTACGGRWVAGAGREGTGVWPPSLLVRSLLIRDAEQITKLVVKASRAARKFGAALRFHAERCARVRAIGSSGDSDGRRERARRVCNIQWRGADAIIPSAVPIAATIAATSASGQTGKIRACPLYVRFTPERVAELPLISSRAPAATASCATESQRFADDLNGSSATRSPTQRTNAEASSQRPALGQVHSGCGCRSRQSPRRARRRDRVALKRAD